MDPSGTPRSRGYARRAARSGSNARLPRKQAALRSLDARDEKGASGSGSKNSALATSKRPSGASATAVGVWNTSEVVLLKTSQEEI